LNPATLTRPRTLSAEGLDNLLRAQVNLLTVAQPFLEDIYQYLEGNGDVVLLADGAACHLAGVGDLPAQIRLQKQGFTRGTYWAEGQIGTNALGTCLLEAAPVQFIGAEHYLAPLHDWVTTAAPVHAVSGRIIAVVGVCGLASQATAHTLALVMAAARAISNQLQATHYLEEANHRLYEVNTIMDTIAEGVLTWNSNSEIQHINSQAAQWLGLDRRKILGQTLDQVLALPPAVQEALTLKQPLHNVEVSFETGTGRQRALVNLHPVRPESPEKESYVLVLHNVEAVRDLIHRQVGTQASLSLEDVTAYSAPMRAVIRQARVAARGTAPVLVFGEGGVGKNVLARAIHDASRRSKRPFITINCRAIPHELMIGELLGYEKNNRQAPANGHHEGRPSKFELAGGGTLLFDQIEHLSLEMQTVLLDIIETGEVLRLGSSRPAQLDVRIMATTDEDLALLVSEGSFLSHLYYRFNVFRIQVPPLRERAEDIALLAERYLARFTERSGQESWLDDPTRDILLRYPWPGNVRELESVLERALAHSPDNVVRVTDLPETVRHGRVVLRNAPLAQPVLSAAEAEREAIIRAGWACHGQVTAMADQLGIGRTTLWRKMKHYNIDRQQFQH
jgi:transcriptional activator for dhaKLM operon